MQSFRCGIDVGRYGSLAKRNRATRSPIEIENKAELGNAFVQRRSRIGDAYRLLRAYTNKQKGARYAEVKELRAMRRALETSHPRANVRAATDTHTHAHTFTISYWRLEHFPTNI